MMLTAKHFKKAKTALSPVIATVVMVVVTIAMIIPVSYWAGGLAAIFTRFEKVEVKNAYVTNSGGNFVINIEYVNTGSSSTSIDSIDINDVSYSSFTPSVVLGGDLSTLPSSCETGVSKTGTIIIKEGATDPSGNKLAAGVTLMLTLHTTGSKKFHATVALQGTSVLSSTVQGNSGTNSSATDSLNGSDPTNSTSPSGNSSTSTIQPNNTMTTNVTDQLGTIYFFDDFESGDLSKWTYNGQIEALPPNTDCLVDSIHVYSGNYAFHSKRVDTSGDNYHWAQITKWGEDTGLYQYRELYYGWMMYIPSNSDSTNWQQLVEWMPEHEGGDYQIMLSLMMEQRTSAPGEPQILRLYRTTPDNCYKEMWTSTKTLSEYLGRWVKVDFYIKQGKGDGAVKMWLDNELVYEAYGLDLRQHSPSLEGDWGHSFHLGLYAHDNPPADVWYDDVYIVNYRRTIP